MKAQKLLYILIATLLTACSSFPSSSYDDDWYMGGGNGFGGGGGSNGQGSMSGTFSPSFLGDIVAWDGTTADDAENDVVGTDKDIYEEVNTFSNTVTVNFNGSSATVESSSKKILTYTTGAYVTIDAQTNDVSKVDIVVSGKTDDGGLKIYGSNKFRLTLNGAEITSQRGCAINSQCKKRIYVVVADGTTNKLTDASSYSDDTYYISESTDEDRKGCFFSEGNLIFSGKGVLRVAGKKKHGIATDGYMWVRPGVTIVVDEAVKNAIHVKGDSDDGIGIHIAGGLIYTNTAGVAGKGIKTDLNIDVTGGKLILYTTGESEYDSDEKDTSSAAGMKADGCVNISGGTLLMRSSGTGGKGINADSTVVISGGEVTVTTTGGKYYYTQDITSSPKGIKADGDITISGGKVNVAVTGQSDGSEGIESKKVFTISGGETYSYAYDDAFNSGSDFVISGGKVFACALNADGIDSNGGFTMTGGTVVALGSGGSEEGVDCEYSSRYFINGGTLIAFGGNVMTTPSTSSKQCMVYYGGVSVTSGTLFSVTDSDGNPIATLNLPKSLSSMTMMFSSPELKKGSSFAIYSGGTLSGATDSWNYWSAGGKLTSATKSATFTCSSSSVITSVGVSGGMSGGGGNRPGGW
jgi:hypothetical protein